MLRLPGISNQFIAGLLITKKLTYRITSCAVIESTVALLGTFFPVVGLRTQAVATWAGKSWLANTSSRLDIARVSILPVTDACLFTVQPESIGRAYWERRIVLQRAINS